MKLRIPVKNISRLLMISTVVLIAAFQAYWINRLYKDELQNLQRETDVLFRDVVYNLQMQRFKSDTSFFKKGMPDNLFVFNLIDSVREVVSLTDSPAHAGQAERKIRISFAKRPGGKTGIEEMETIRRSTDSFALPLPPGDSPPELARFFSSNKKLNDSLPVAGLDTAYKKLLALNGISLPFTINSVAGKVSNAKDAVAESRLATNFAFAGLGRAYAYQAVFANPFNFIMGKIKLQLLLSLLLLAVTVLSFVFLYRNLIAQRRIAIIKDEFISNITHELKTPIATMTVAIEALRNFNALESPQKTREYLDISAAELQRLSLLVDKVLRLSMLENEQITLNRESFNLYQLAEEIIATMKLQFEKSGATVTLERSGDRFAIEADRLHITSVIYNLFDNALKYSREKPAIHVKIISHPGFIELLVKDNGIGIAQEYRQKIFEKFFRVPVDSHHNIKGYGLGLSYVNHIAMLHHGFIEVTSEQEKGSTFSVKLPYKEAAVVHYDKGRVIRKMVL